MTRIVPAARISASVIAAIGLALFALQIVLSIGKTGSFVGAMLVLTRFFTILTNAAVVVAMLRVGIGRVPGHRFMLAMVTAIAMVGIVYHAVLADLQNLSGLDLLTDRGFHTAIPLLTVVWWVLFGGTPGVVWRDLAWVLPWPIAYCAYALVRGAMSGIYPYPFIDLPVIGWAMLMMNVAVLAAIFAVVGAVFVAVARTRRHSLA
ncbi:Pr6Pr family membrane protein [Croceicoccus bisphenolivorans]|uniref:Pr6Pr family membrane protein n=1 Tax=Croceicoccus bisphenolivorans TaxID=1783232 RepID=UPI00082E8235|nr:Pr6Pr family membrane protein [Croceicoccus bisphenolivorans]